MQYTQIPGDTTAIIWQDKAGNSGVIRDGDPLWSDYQEWLAAGNTLEPLTFGDDRSLDELRTAAFANINVAADSAMLPLSSQYPRCEIDSWPEQCKEARAWLAKSSVPTPLLDAIGADADDEQKRQLSDAILSKSETYKIAVGAVIAWRRAMTDFVATVEDRDVLMLFRPNYPELPHE